MNWSLLFSCFDVSLLREQTTAVSCVRVQHHQFMPRTVNKFFNEWILWKQRFFRALCCQLAVPVFICAIPDNLFWNYNTQLMKSAKYFANFHCREIIWYYEFFAQFNTTHSKRHFNAFHWNLGIVGTWNSVDSWSLTSNQHSNISDVLVWSLIFCCMSRMENKDSPSQNMEQETR